MSNKNYDVDFFIDKISKLEDDQIIPFKLGNEGDRCRCIFGHLGANTEDDDKHTEVTVAFSKLIDPGSDCEAGEEISTGNAVILINDCYNGKLSRKQMWLNKLEEIKAKQTQNK